jgi:dipeptidyl aminopeptidase/acylaminoacyl peptidase
MAGGCGANRISCPDVVSRCFIPTTGTNHAQSGKDPNADVNFRLGYVEDVINAVEAVKKSDLPTIDKENIGMLGHSMGGGVTLNTLVIKPGLVKAAGLYAAVSGNQRDNFNRWTVTRPETAERITELYGTPETNKKFWDEISAINYLDRVAAPILILHGTADESVPIAWSDDLNRRLNDLGKPVTYNVYPGEPHEFASAWPGVMESTADFFSKHLKQKQP